MTEIPVERLVLLFCVLKGILCLPQQFNNHYNPRHLQGPTLHWGQNQRPHLHSHSQGERHGGMCADFRNPTPSITQPEVNNENLFQTPTFVPKKINSPPMLALGLQIPDAETSIQLDTNTNGMCKPDQAATHRYHIESGTCQRLKAKGVCRSLMVLYTEADNITGYCDCQSHVGNTLKPLVYWGATDQCYHLYEQGPCAAGKWLTQIGVKPPVCSKRSCPPNSEDETQYWFTHQGMCFQADTLNEDTKEFCKSNTMKLYHVEDYQYENNLGYLRCMERAPPVPITRTLVQSAGDLPCKPGHKKSLNGECSRIAKFI